MNSTFHVSETDLILSQRQLMERVAEQERMIEYQATKIEKIENVVYQLLGGLFNQKTQENILNRSLDMLEDGDELVCRSPHTNIINTKSKWGTWPTTRQGDDSEMRIQELEKELKYVKRCVVFYNEYDHDSSTIDGEEEEEEDDNSTHSSMPELEEQIIDTEDV